MTAAAALALTGCGKSADDLFSNLNGHNPPRAHGSSSPTTQAPSRDAPPNHPDNNRVRQPGEMTPEDESTARQKATAVEHALTGLRMRGTINPADVRPVLTRIAGPSHLTVGDLLIGTALTKTEGSDYGIWIGDTACVTGAVTKDRVWVEVNGHYPETGCVAPPASH
ncbi:hypothetical protein CG740_20575 [Streptomyces sp. CB01201]|uniref:hypothetical protein n=1 Tax=unclassified Streptomyces TaxID=2593676 RepID=UPI000C2796AB|nr:hypothetical protein [Streptomyces sp. CB01201]PJN01083.1 hypothetical protein CG740_20575 [Streptomyces sp. CB01201]